MHITVGEKREKGKESVHTCNQWELPKLCKEVALSAMDEQLNQKVRNFPNLLSLQDILQFGTIHILGLYEKKKKIWF